MKGLKWAAGVFAVAFVNCLADHVVSCLFEKAGLNCPRKGSA
jgi:hypothetical protein